MIVQLIVRNEGQAGKRIRIKDPLFLIGRDDVCQLRSSSHSVSSRHCVIVQHRGRVFIKDLGSRNGTFVNNENIGSGNASELVHRDKIHIGKMSFRIIIRDSETMRPIDDVKKCQKADHTIAFLNRSKFRSLKPDPLV